MTSSGYSFMANMSPNDRARRVLRKSISIRSCLARSLRCSTVVQAPSSAQRGSGWRK